MEAAGFEELGRASVVGWWQEVAGHKNESRFAGHFVFCGIWKGMMMMFAYDDDDDEMCYSRPRLILTIFIAYAHIYITS